MSHGNKLVPVSVYVTAVLLIRSVFPSDLHVAGFSHYLDITSNVAFLERPQREALLSTQRLNLLGSHLWKA